MRSKRCVRALTLYADELCLVLTGPGTPAPDRWHVRRWRAAKTRALRLRARKGRSHDGQEGLTALSYGVCSTAMGYGGQGQKTADTVPTGCTSGRVQRRVVARPEGLTVGHEHAARTARRSARHAPDRGRGRACIHWRTATARTGGFPSRSHRCSGACPAADGARSASAGSRRFCRIEVRVRRGCPTKPYVAFLTRQKKQAYRRNGR